MLSLVMKSNVNVVKTPFLLPNCRSDFLPPKKNLVFLKKSMKKPLPVQSLFFKKPPTPVVKEPSGFTAAYIGGLVYKAGFYLGMALQIWLKKVDKAIPYVELKVAMYVTTTACIAWALQAIGSGILSKRRRADWCKHFKEDDLVEYMDKEAYVMSIGTSSVKLFGNHGPFNVDYTIDSHPTITNLTREVPSPGGVRKLLAFHLNFNVGRKHKEICQLVKEYMNSNEYLKDQEHYNVVIPLPNEKIQVIGYICCSKLPSPQFENYTSIKAEIVSQLYQLIDENKPIILCDTCQAKIFHAAGIMKLIDRGRIYDKDNSG